MTGPEAPRETFRCRWSRDSPGRVIPAGKEIPPHRAPGEITVQCIEGHVAFEDEGHTLDLYAGDLLYLCPQETHALKGVLDSTVLVTRLRPHADELPETFPSS
jgi:quercetin dioxygenase-like cupin family protein